MKAFFKYLLLNFKSMSFGMFFNHFNQIKPTKKNEPYVFVDLRLFFPFNVILMRIIHIEIDKKALF